VNENNTAVDYGGWRRSPWQRMSVADWPKSDVVVTRWGHAYL